MCGIFRIKRFLLPSLVMVLIWTAGPVYALNEVYALHVSSYKSAGNAEAAVADYRARGLPSFVRYENIPGKGMWHRVYLGRFSSRGEAAEQGRLLKSQGTIDYYSVKSVDGAMMASNTLAPSTMQKSADADIVCEGGVCAARPKEPAATTDYETVQEITTEAVCPATAMETAETETVYRNDKKTDEQGFVLAVRPGVTILPNARNFKITKNNNGNTEEWDTDTRAAFHLGLAPSYRFNRIFSLEGMVEKPLAGDLDAWFLGLGPKVHYTFDNGFSPYFRGGLVYGFLDWRGAPGNFRNAVGWEVGGGVDYNRDNFVAGVDLKYRGVGFKYSPSSNTTSNKDYLDLSGPVLSATLGYRF